MSRRTQVILNDTAPVRTAPTVTGTAFLASVPQKGLLDPQRTLRSLTEVERYHGPRQDYSVFWDWCELFFREGGRTLYVSPVRGPAAASASLNLAGTGTTLVVTAKSVGEWANGAAGGLTAEVANGPSGGTHRVIIVRLGGVEAERTPEFNDRALAPAFSDVLEHVNITLGGGSGLPAVAAAANLAGGTLDRLNITQTQVTAALALLAKDLGPGQEACPDWQTPTAHQALIAHCGAVNRFGLCDTADTLVKATLSTAGNAVQGDTNSLHGCLYAPWVPISGTAGGTTRYVPASAFLAAKCNQVDQAAGPGQAPAGQYGRATSSLVKGVRGTFSDQDAADLEAAGVNLIISRFGEVRADGNRSLVEPAGPDSEWLQIGACRLRMAITAEADSIGQTFEHEQITPILIAKFDMALTGMMMRFSPQLYPGDNDPGFAVDTGDSVNTPATIAAKQLRAAISFRPAPGADMVTIYLTPVGIGEPVS